MRKDNESFLEYQKRKMDSISPSFCAAKWLNATIWLDQGKTASCHHPPFHDINKKEIRKNPSAIHNTQQKKAARTEMLAGTRPKECEYCWKVEDIQRGNVSDRVFKTEIYSDEDIDAISSANPSANANLRTLEVSFDRTCNFACAYCNASFSSTWARDLNQNGPYTGLETHDARTYIRDPKNPPVQNSIYQWFAQFAPNSDQPNPYVKAFWKWWPELSQSLAELRVTGGEPLMSTDVWQLFDELKKHPQIRFAVNSNLGASDKLIDRLIEKSREIKTFDLYTSNEAFGPHAEYIRDGLNFQRWRENVLKIKRQGNIRSLHVMMTVNALCLYSISNLFDEILSWRKELGRDTGIWTLNILRFPSFLNVLVLPDHIKEERKQHLQRWLDANGTDPLLHEMEVAAVQRLIDYLDSVKTPHQRAGDRDEKARDLKRFLLQYDRRRGKNFLTTFGGDLENWIQSIDVS